MIRTCISINMNLHCCTPTFIKNMTAKDLEMSSFQDSLLYRKSLSRIKPKMYSPVMLYTLVGVLGSDD